MSKVSIYETGWLNLVFEGKNKEYGAFQLRQESPKTTLFAFFFGLLFVGTISAGGLLLSSFGTAPLTDVIPDPDVIIRVDKYDPVKPEEPPMPPKVEKSTPITEVTDKKDLTNNVEVTTTEKADEIKTKSDPPAAPDPGLTGTDTGTTTTTTGTTTATGTGEKPALDPNATHTTVNIDVMPEFPGGITKFYAYVGNNFEKPEIEETVNVLMSFVIEKDGTMTDIKVLRNPGYGLDKEAIRVLKSLKTKWKPGIKNGQPVRVLYTLPIKVTRS